VRPFSGSPDISQVDLASWSRLTGVGVGATLVFLALPLLRAVKRGLRSFRQARTALLLPGTEQSTVRSQLSIRRRTAARPWVEHRSPAANPALVAVVSATTWFAAIDRTLYRTTDGGTSWSTVRGSLNVGGVQASNTLDFVNTVDGWAVVEGRVWHTTDEGRMWVLEVLPT